MTDLATLDEMLELLFWMEGENLDSSATLTGIARFLARPESDALDVLSRLVERGDIVVAEGRYVLTDVGRREAARRFVEDFSGLTGQAHGECNDPECECRKSPAGAADCQAHRQGAR